jgi:hypothetical protein
VLTKSPHFSYDLATDQEASHDLQTFAQSQFDLVALTWCLSTPWPEESLFNRVISQANGLFIFVMTLVLTLEKCSDPEESLGSILRDSDGAGLEPLYRLYSQILREQIVLSNGAEFQWMIGVLLMTAPFCPLCEEPIAALAGVKPNLVGKWIDDLSSLLYQDRGANGGIHVWHLSISDFFVSRHCVYQVNLRDANVHLGISCLKTMVSQLCFNICNFDDSQLANADVEDLPS